MSLCYCIYQNLVECFWQNIWETWGNFSDLSFSTTLEHSSQPTLANLHSLIDSQLSSCTCTAAQLHEPGLTYFAIEFVLWSVSSQTATWPRPLFVFPKSVHFVTLSKLSSDMLWDVDLLKSHKIIFSISIEFLRTLSPAVVPKVKFPWGFRALKGFKNKVTFISYII